MAYSCTSGTVAVGLDAVRKAIHAVRPGIPVITPVGDGAAALKALGCKRISFLCPYRFETGDLVTGYLRDNGIEITRQATFVLDGDPDMNRLSAEALIEAGRRVFDPASDGLFLSCTGLYSYPVVEKLEQAIGKPVVSSNQALAWASLRAAKIDDRLEGRGMLFRKH
jgi:maleate isomerase